LVSCWVASFTFPVNDDPSKVGGIHAAGIFKASRSSADQSLFLRSKRTVPDPSALSMANSPVRR
jgi:hypothetical protein